MRRVQIIHDFQSKKVLQDRAPSNGRRLYGPVEAQPFGVGCDTLHASAPGVGD